jgi:hypothetical protein
MQKQLYGSETARNFTENPIVQLAFENIRYCQNQMRAGFDIEQDIVNLVRGIPDEIISKDKEDIQKLINNLVSEKNIIYNLPLPERTYPWSRRHISEWRHKQIVPKRDATYSQIINIVINRLHSTYIDSEKKMGSEL